jgi:hypothetical protein
MLSLPIGTDIGLSSKISKPVVRFTQCPIKRYWDLLCPGVNRPGVQADDAVLLCFEMKNTRSCNSTP